ncbi:13027_t:CDS:2 [Funneliformis geosporum]|nr:13027_t:CDS:2 [Funneliformis geosporum]
MKKITIIGNKGVGKTILFRQLVKNYSSSKIKGEIKPSPLINYTESIIEIGDNIYKLIDTPSFILSPKTEVEKGIKEQAENLLKRDLENSEEEFYSSKTLQPQYFLAISLKLLIFGSPNSGKSTLMNYLLKENRSLATPTAGTTQEPVIKQKLKEKILQIVNLGERHNKPLIIIINKCDLLKEKKVLKEELKSRLKSLGYVPIIYASALKGTGIKSLLKILEKMLEQSQKKLSKKALAELIEKMLLNNPPKYHKGNKLKIYFAKQELGTHLPTVPVDETKLSPTSRSDNFREYSIFSTVPKSEKLTDFIDRLYHSVFDLVVENPDGTSQSFLKKRLLEVLGANNI